MFKSFSELLIDGLDSIAPPFVPTAIGSSILPWNIGINLSSLVSFEIQYFVSGLYYPEIAAKL